MDFRASKLLFLLLVCWISVIEGDGDAVREVQTLPSVSLEAGMEGKLTCGYNRIVHAVYWRYKSTTSPMKLLVVIDQYYHVGERSGPGYDEGRFNVTDDYSLIIHDVTVKDEGIYMCEVSDFLTGQAYRNYTDVTTIVKAERPFPRIGQCENDVSADEINGACFLRTTSDDPNIELTCTVVGAKPMAILSWTSSLSAEYWKQLVNGSTLTKKGRGDGIFDQTLAVSVETSYFTSDIEHFTCVAEGLAVDGIAKKTIAIYSTLEVYADKPYVKIKPCEHFTTVNQSEDFRETCCTYVTDNQTSFQISCSVMGAKPNVSLFWMQNETNVGSSYVLTSIFANRGDGTSDQTLELTVRVNETMNGTVFTCVAEGVAVDGKASSSVTFFKVELYHNQPDIPDKPQKSNIVAIAVPLIIACLILISAVTIFVWKRRNRQENPSYQAPAELV